ncbi:MAG: zinc-ribbon domain-containing protein, partial [Nitrospinae bacterium]|nr:zinc-ribbon domain-containing protein [Nitrospinota bacterium]
MVIKCPRCSSRYKIDGAGVADEGTYARCRKCENVFFVRKRSHEEVSALRKS